MKKTTRGRAWCFGDNINTDVITPGKYENLPMKEMIRHCLEPINQEFANKVERDDILVAGENFGCGSAREIAPEALKSLGLCAVIAESFSRTFYRNAVAIGLSVLIAESGLRMCKDGDILEVDLENAQLWNRTSGFEIPMEPMDGFLYEILSKGGIFSVDL